jgi:hypothetical protein
MSVDCMSASNRALQLHKKTTRVIINLQNSSARKIDNRPNKAYQAKVFSTNETILRNLQSHFCHEMTLNYTRFARNSALKIIKLSSSNVLFDYSLG